MRSRLMVIFFICCALGLTHCGRSTSSNDSNKSLEQEEAFDPFCTNFENSDQCQEFRETGREWGFEDYFGDDDHSDDAFYGGGGFCGCRRGFRPILYRGTRMCERGSRDGIEGKNGIRFRYRIKVGEPGKGKLRISFVIGSLRGSHKSNDGLCFQDAGMRCRKDRDCRVKNGRGYWVETTCEPIRGKRYGYCRERSSRFH